MSQGPADLAGLEHKGRIEIGADADLVALADDETFTVTKDLIKHRHPITPYLGQELRGVVRTRWLRGTRTDRRHGRRTAAHPRHLPGVDAEMKRTDLDLASRALGGSVRVRQRRVLRRLRGAADAGPRDARHRDLRAARQDLRRLGDPAPAHPGYDWAVVALGVPGVLHEIVVDTSFFLGQLPA